MKKRRLGKSADRDAEFQDLVNNITRVINRPSLADMTVQQAYAILNDFQNRFLTEEEQALPRNDKHAVWEKLVTSQDFAKRDLKLNQVIGLLAIGGEAYAKKKAFGLTPLVNLLDDAQTTPLIMAWNTIEHAKGSDDPIVQKIGENLQLAFYANLPSKNNLQNPDSAIRRINTTGKGNGGFSK